MPILKISDEAYRLLEDLQKFYKELANGTGSPTRKSIAERAIEEYAKRILKREK